MDSERLVLDFDASNSDTGLAWGYAQYEARVWGSEDTDPKQTGAGALLPDEQIEVQWVPDGSEPQEFWIVDGRVDWDPHAEGGTTVVNEGQIMAQVSIQITDITMEADGVDISPSSIFYPGALSQTRQQNQSSNYHPGPSQVNLIWNTDTVTDAPEIYVSTTTSVYATWDGDNPGTTSGDVHSAAFRAWAQVGVTLPAPSP